MPRKTTTVETIEEAVRAPPSTEEQLATIVHILHRLDKRDRLRTIGGFFRSVIALIPVLLVIASAWYFYQHGDEVIKQITDASVKSMTPQMSTQGDILQQLQRMFPNMKLSTSSSSASRP